jgi:hypothetical protein
MARFALCPRLQDDPGGRTPRVIACATTVTTRFALCPRLQDQPGHGPWGATSREKTTRGSISNFVLRISDSPHSARVRSSKNRGVLPQSRELGSAPRGGPGRGNGQCHRGGFRRVEMLTQSRPCRVRSRDHQVFHLALGAAHCCLQALAYLIRSRDMNDRKRRR